MKRILIVCLAILLLVSGCWDQRLVKDINLIYSQALDHTDDKLIETTIVTIGGTQMQGGAQSENSTEPAVISATGNTPRDSRMNLDKKVSGQLFTSKNRVTLLSKSIAEENIYSVLDVHYRSPLSTTNARIAVVEGQAKKALQVRNEESPLISDFLGDLLYSLEETMLIPDSSLEVVMSKLFDEGLDTALPLLKVIDNETVVFNGLALFDKDHMTGKLDSDQSLRLLLMDKKRIKPRRFNIKVTDDEENPINNYVTVDVEEKKRDLIIKKEVDGKYSANVDLSLTLNVVEYPKDTLYIEEHTKQLNQEVKNKLQLECEEVIRLIQEANSDYFGIGKQIMAFHYKDWIQMDWEEEYAKMDINTSVDTEIIYHGIVN